jgi:hypothetical protein
VALVRTDVSEERIASISSVFQLLVTANVVCSSLILFALMMKAIRFSETSTRATRQHIPEDGILGEALGRHVLTILAMCDDTVFFRLRLPRLIHNVGATPR